MGGNQLSTLIFEGHPERDHWIGRAFSFLLPSKQDSFLDLFIGIDYQCISQNYCGNIAFIRVTKNYPYE